MIACLHVFWFLPTLSRPTITRQSVFPASSSRVFSLSHDWLIGTVFVSMQLAGENFVLALLSKH